LAPSLFVSAFCSERGSKLLPIGAMLFLLKNYKRWDMIIVA